MRRSNISVRVVLCYSTVVSELQSSCCQLALPYSRRRAGDGIYGFSTCVSLLDTGGHALVNYSVHTAIHCDTKRAAVYSESRTVYAFLRRDVVLASVYWVLEDLSMRTRSLFSTYR